MDADAAIEKVAGLWIPAHDIQLRRVLTARVHPWKRLVVRGVMSPQWMRIRLALALLPETRRRLAVDVGANVGTWAMWLARQFLRVAAFEPQPLVMQCLAKNARSANVELHQSLLGDRTGIADMEVPADHMGAGRIADGETSHAPRGTALPIADWSRLRDIPINRLDDFAFRELDLLKVDAEGHDLAVLRGGEKTIMRDRPVIVVEQIGTNAAVDWLIERGATEMNRMKGDVFMAWR